MNRRSAFRKKNDNAFEIMIQQHWRSDDNPATLRIR